MSCIHCNETAKYKCPTCEKPYCSVLCYKKHKAVPCSASPPPMPQLDTQPQFQYEFPTEDTVAVEMLDLLEHSKELQNCLANRHLRALLEVLDRSPYPDSLIQEYMQEPIFTEFVDECLKVVQPAEENLEP